MVQRLQAKRNEEGFTLIELLIVIIVLGILAAIVVFAVGSTRSDAVSASCKTAVKSVELSAEAQNTKVGSYPAKANSSNSTSTILSANGGLLKSWPSDSDYVIQWNPTHGAAAGPPVVAGVPTVEVFPKGYTVTGGVVMTNDTPPVAATDAQATGCPS